MVNHAPALNYHTYKLSSGAQLCTCTLFHRAALRSSQLWTVDSGQVARRYAGGSILPWENGFFFFLAAVADLPYRGSAKSMLPIFKDLMFFNWRPTIPLKHLYRQNCALLHQVQVHHDPAPAQDCQPICPLVQTIDNQSHPILPSETTWPLIELTVWFDQIFVWLSLCKQFPRTSF